MLDLALVYVSTYMLWTSPNTTAGTKGVEGAGEGPDGREREGGGRRVRPRGTAVSQPYLVL